MISTFLSGHGLLFISISISISLLFFYPPITAAGDNNDYYDAAFLGQKDFELYYGPLGPLSVFDPYTHSLNFLDDLRLHHFFDTLLEGKVSKLEKFFKSELPAGMDCPNEILSEHISYIHYLFRLISLSFLYEAMRSYQQVAQSLDIQQRNCRFDWDQILLRCRPKNQEMTKFIERAKVAVYAPQIETIEHLRAGSRSYTQVWVQRFNDLKTDAFPKGPGSCRILQKCNERNESCHRYQFQDISQRLNQICLEDMLLFQRICSEEDHLYGLSYVESFPELLSQSNTMNIIDRQGKGKQCLNRFIEIFRNKEFKNNNLKELFQEVEYAIKNNKQIRYKQGNLFLPGALREFDEKGLSGFLYQRPTPTPSPSPTPSPTPTPTPTPTPSPTPTPTPTPTPSPTPTPTPTPTPSPTPKISSFLREHKILREKNLEKIDLNMDEFRDDFIFDEQKRHILNKNLHKFQTRQALQDMKKLDQLGTAQGPLELLFLKFLIDEESHQGLYNILAVLGPKFFVQNDIDNVPGAVFIELFLNETQGGRWQIRLLKDPPPAAPAGAEAQEMKDESGKKELNTKKKEKTKK